MDTSCPSPGAVRVVVVGEIDMATSGRLRDELLNVLFTLRPRRIEVELAEVTFLDCSGVTALIAAGRIAARTGCRLRIMNPQAVVYRVLSLTGLLGVLTAEIHQASFVAVDADVTSAGILPSPGRRAARHAIRSVRPDPCGAGALAG
jgi:anti-anti-sigma factor